MVDFGKFVTGFLVVMGIGECKISSFSSRLVGMYMIFWICDCEARAQLSGGEKEWDECERNGLVRYRESGQTFDEKDVGRIEPD